MKSANDLLTELHIFEKMNITNDYKIVICLDDYIHYEVEQAILDLNQMFNDYEFYRQELYSGFAHNLVIIDKQKKEKYDKIRKTKTKKDLLDYLHENNIHLCGTINEELDQLITDEEFQESIDFFEEIVINE